MLPSEKRGEWESVLGFRNKTEEFIFHNVKDDETAKKLLVAIEPYSRSKESYLDWTIAASTLVLMLWDGEFIDEMASYSGPESGRCKMVLDHFGLEPSSEEPTTSVDEVIRQILEAPVEVVPS